MNWPSKWLNFRVSRIDRALFAMVVFFTPSHSLSWSAVACGDWAGSNRKLSCPTAWTTPAAQILGSAASQWRGSLPAEFADHCTAQVGVLGIQVRPTDLVGHHHHLIGGGPHRWWHVHSVHPRTFPGSAPGDRLP